MLARGSAKQRAKLDGMAKETIVWLVGFLEPFKTETTMLEGDSYPTLPMVAPASYNLRKHCGENVADTPTQACVRARALRILKEKFKPTMQHTVATFLVPLFRQLPKLEDEERAEVM